MREEEKAREKTEKRIRERKGELGEEQKRRDGDGEVMCLVPRQPNQTGIFIPLCFNGVN